MGAKHGEEVLICGRCYGDYDELFPANCKEDPGKLKGQPIGQYHCPDCGAMVLAGIPHPKLCKLCLDRKHPGFDQLDKIMTLVWPDGTWCYPHELEEKMISGWSDDYCISYIPMELPEDEIGRIALDIANQRKRMKGES